MSVVSFFFFSMDETRVDLRFPSIWSDRSISSPHALPSPTSIELHVFIDETWLLPTKHIHDSGMHLLDLMTMASVCSAAAVSLDGAVAGATTTTAIEDIPGDVLSLVLRRLDDGASLAALGCACSAFRELAADAETWRGLCLATWPSLRDVDGLDECGGVTGGGGYRALFADAFPLPAEARGLVPSSASLLPARLVSAVDLHHGEVCLMSRVVETDASSEWFLGSPFRVDALVQEGFSAPAPITPAELTLSWILIDPATGRAVNASSRRPVSVDREWLAGETVARFTVVLGGGVVALDAAVTCDDRHGHVREVSLRAEDGDGGGVSGRGVLAAVAAAMEGARHGRGAEAAAWRRYEAFARGRAARKVKKARRDGAVDFFCSGVAAAAFVGVLSTLTLR